MATMYTRRYHNYESQCEGKRRYTSRRAALSGVRLGRNHGESVHAYPCPFCKQWHVGHFQKALDRRRITRNTNDLKVEDFDDD